MADYSLQVVLLYIMTTRAILITYLDRKKLLKFPDGEGLDFLAQEFKKVFSINVNLKVHFQRFNSEFDEYVELEEEDVLHHKDKLIAITSTDSSASTPTMQVVAEHSFESSETFDVSISILALTLRVVYVHKSMCRN